jgi:hypothetical protein
MHYYLLEQTTSDGGKPPDPSNRTTTWHYPTVIRYMKYLCEVNNDPGVTVCDTEYGWVMNIASPAPAMTEQQKAITDALVQLVARPTEEKPVAPDGIPVALSPAKEPPLQQAPASPKQ